MVALDNSENQKPAYHGVLSFEQKLPYPQLMFPLLFGLFYGLSKVLGTLPHPWSSSVAGIDDLARLAQARDLLNGQGWFDLLQTRLDPPNGVWMHWSRLVDAPIAGLIWIGERLGVGDALALMLWPVMLLVAFFTVIALASRALFGDKGIFFSVFVTLFFESTLRTFAPGRIDHHNVQIVLAALLLLSMLRLSDGYRWGMTAGLIAAIMMAIGIETLPLVAVAAGLAAVLWCWDAPRFGAGTRAVGFSFAGSAAMMFALSVPASRYALTQCDSISLVHLVLAGVGGIGIACISLVVPAQSSRLAKLSALGFLAVACGAIAHGAFSHCLGDPYAFLDPRLREVWLDNVSEARSALALIGAEPSVFYAAFIPMGVFVLIAGWALWSVPAEQKVKWVVLSAFALTGIAVSLVQVRFVQITHLFCIPAAAWVMAQTFDQIRERGATIAKVALLVCVPVLASPWLVVLSKIAMAGPTRDHTVFASESGMAPVNSVVGECQSQVDQDAMAALAPGLVATPIFYGSTVLGMSDLSVLSAPYHRAQDAILDTHAIFSSPPDAALEILERRDIDYVMLCLSSTVRLVNGTLYPEGLVAALENAAPPDWLELLPSDETSFLRIYRVRQAN